MIMWSKNSKLSEIINSNLRASIVMEKYGLDFCFNGNKSLLDACSAKGLNADKMMEELLNIEKEKSGFIRFELWDIDFITGYIVNNHHKYIRQALPKLERLCNEVLYSFSQYRTSDKDNPTDVFYSIVKLSHQVVMHLEKEEKMIFPYINKLIGISREGKEFEYAPFGVVENPLSVLQKEHAYIAKELEKIQDELGALMTQYPENKELEQLAETLSEFAKDFHIHIHIENNILFPKTIELEQDLRNRQETNFSNTKK